MSALLALLLASAQTPLPHPLVARNLGVLYRVTRHGRLSLDEGFLAISEVHFRGLSRKFAYDRAHGLRQLATSAVQNDTFAHEQHGSLMVTIGSESLMGDLNGDGDALDLCVIATDLASGASMPPRAIGVLSPTFASVGRDLAGLRVQENRDGISLNGDLDATDAVAFAWRPGDAPLNLGLACTDTFVLEDALVMVVSESGQGRDYTEDGDQTDLVYAVHDFVSGRTTHALVAAHPFGNPVSAGPRLFAFLASESGSGADLDGDDLLASTVLQVYRIDAGEVVNLKTAASPGGYFAVGDRVAYTMSEARAGDLNRDSDTLDQVVHLYDGVQGSGLSLGLASDPSRFHATLGGTALAVEVDEAAQGVDLNGDGDLGDHVVSVRDLAIGRTFDTGLSGMPDADGGMLLHEHANGDLNGDGDTDDAFLHLLGAGATPGVTLGLQAAKIGVSGERVLLLAAEGALGADLNGDGDLADEILHVYRPSTGALTNIGIDPAGAHWNGRFLLQARSEAGQGDWNGDGDSTDHVLFLYDLDVGTAHDLGFAVSLDDPILMSDELWAFVVDEDAQGVDLDGNGLIEDVRVLHVIDRTRGLRAP